MQLDARTFAVAKDPDQASEYQDACAMDLQRGIVAIADGVSSAIFSGPWASILAEAVVADDPDPENREQFAAWLQQQRSVWSSRIDTNGLAWFQRAKLPAGAFSTLLWVRLAESATPQAGTFGGARLLAYAIGDTCMFQVRGGELVRTFPLQTSAELQTDPVVLGSVDLKRDHLLQFAVLDEFCYPGDLLILCTDALAEWALKEYESGRQPVWENYWSMSEEDWRAEIAWLRHERQMRYDDTTLVLLQVVPERVEPAASEPGAEPAEALPEAVLADDVPPAAEPVEALPEAMLADDVPPPATEASFTWLESMSKEVKSVSAQMAEQVDQASERMLKGLKVLKEKGFKALKEKALQKYREKFGKDEPPPEKK